MYERRLQPSLTKTNADTRNTTSMYQMAADKSFTEEVNQKTDIVTHRLKELIHSMQDPSKCEILVPCAERIRAAVLELINVFTTPVSFKNYICFSFFLLEQIPFCLFHLSE